MSACACMSTCVSVCVYVCECRRVGLCERVQQRNTASGEIILQLPLTVDLNSFLLKAILLDGNDFL